MNMIGYEQDPDVVRWGLHLLDICSLSNAGSGSSVTRYDADLSQVEYVGEGYYEEQHNSVENDEIIAHALQEELSHIAAAEASGLSNVGKDHLQASILAQDWLGPSKRHPGSGIGKTCSFDLAITDHVDTCFNLWSLNFLLYRSFFSCTKRGECVRMSKKRKRHLWWSGF